MSEVTIRSGDFSTPEELHRYLMRSLEFPEYYGGNLSALYDCLTERCHPATIILQCDRFRNREMEEYFARVLRVCLDAAEENENIAVEYED